MLLQSPRRGGCLGLYFARLITHSAASPEASLLLFDCVFCRRGPAGRRQPPRGMQPPCAPRCRTAPALLPAVTSPSRRFSPGMEDFPFFPSFHPEPFASGSGCAASPKPPLSPVRPGQGGWVGNPRRSTGGVGEPCCRLLFIPIPLLMASGVCPAAAVAPGAGDTTPAPPRHIRKEEEVMENDGEDRRQVRGRWGLNPDLQLSRRERQSR